MNAVAYKTKDGLYCIARSPSDNGSLLIRRALHPRIDLWAGNGPGDICDYSREYRRTNDTHLGFPVYEEC